MSLRCSSTSSAGATPRRSSIASSPETRRARRRPGLVHAVVRRAGQGHRRWDRDACRRPAVPVDRRRSEPQVARRERRRGSPSRSTMCRIVWRRSRCRAPPPAACSTLLHGRRRRGAEVLPDDARDHCRRRGRDLTDRVHRRSGLRDLDAVGTRHRRLGRADRAGPAVRHPPGGNAGARRGADRGRPAAHRRRLLEQPARGHRVAAVFAVRAGPGEAGSLDKGPFVGRQAARRGASARGEAKRVAGLEIGWPEIERLYERRGMAPEIPATASRVAVPVYRDGRQIGRATSTTWSPVLKKLIALATLDAPHFKDGTLVDFEITVDAVRHRVPATVVPTPFFNPARKTAKIRKPGPKARLRPGCDRVGRSHWTARARRLFRAHERIPVVPRRAEVLLDRPRADPADQIQLRPGLVVGARRAGAAERLLADDRAGGLVVDVEVAGGIPERRSWPRAPRRDPARRPLRSTHTARSHPPAPASPPTSHRRRRRP